VVPLATGIIVDSSGSIATGLLLPAACYAVIAAFGWFTTRQPRAA
jgi:FHS family L-fucose permease-like MFS transporter